MANTRLSLSPSRRAWHRFRRNRLGYWSLVVFCALVVLSLCAELISSDRPLIVRYEGQTFFPIIKDYPEKTFGGDFETSTDYLDPFIRERFSKPGNWAVYAPNPYGPDTLNYFAPGFPFYDPLWQWEGPDAGDLARGIGSAAWAGRAALVLSAALALGGANWCWPRLHSRTKMSTWCWRRAAVKRWSRWRPNARASVRRH